MSTKNKDVFVIRGNVFEGKVISAKAARTVTVLRDITRFVNKYERYKKTHSKIKAHVPQNLKVTEGDVVRIGETRKISKTKSFIVMEVLQKAPEKRLIEDVKVETKKPTKSEETQ